MTIKAFSPNRTVTFEKCPVCDEPDVKVENGEAVEIIDGVAHGTGIEQNLWHCPNCGDSVATVIRLDAPLFTLEPEQLELPPAS